MIEQAIVGTEVGCAVLGNGADLFVGEVDQITLRHGIFRIHQEAEPETGLGERGRHRARGSARSAARRDPRDGEGRSTRHSAARGSPGWTCSCKTDGRIVLNEVNTLPGFTTYSRYPRMMAAAGLGLSELIDRCIALAMER